jgi:hypothetical protein
MQYRPRGHTKLSGVIDLKFLCLSKTIGSADGLLIASDSYCWILNFLSIELIFSRVSNSVIKDANETCVIFLEK